MEKTVFNRGLHDFKEIKGGFSFIHNDEEITVNFDDIEKITMEGNLEAKSGAYVLLFIETPNYEITLHSDIADFFEMSEYINASLDTDIEAVFAISYANSKTTRIIFDRTNK